MDKLIIGCGYLGKRIAGLWLAQGHRVFVTTRSEQRFEELRNLGVEPIHCDVLEPKSLVDLPKVETVAHCVGLDRASGRTMRHLYVDGLANLLVRLPSPKRFLYVSSTSVYGQKHGEEVDEDSATEPEEESGRVVLEAEKLLRERLPMAVILRFAGIYGPGRLLRRRAIERGETICADPNRWLNLIHVDDGAAAVLAAESKSQPGEIYNIADGTPVHRRDFYAQLASLLGAGEPHYVLPDPGSPLPPHERPNRRILAGRLRRELDWRPRYGSYEEGLKAAVALA